MGYILFRGLEPSCEEQECLESAVPATLSERHLCLPKVERAPRVVQTLPANARDAGDTGSIPGQARFPEGGHGNPLRYGQRRLEGDNPQGHKESAMTCVNNNSNNNNKTERASLHHNKE